MLAYADTLRHLYARTNGGIKLGLETIRALLAGLGHPEERLARVVLVAGTNGKGSTATLVHGALRAAGHRVGFFPSPHLLRFTERIQVAGRSIEPDEVVELYARVLEVEGHCPRPPTFFECTTAMAVTAFARHGAEVAVLEVGLGGRLDATNAIARDLAVITPIGLDHQQYLGGTIAAIATEKADIIPAQGKAVISDQPAEARAVLTETAAARLAELRFAPTATVEGSCLRIAGTGLTAPLVLHEWPRVAYQRANLATAALACQTLDELGVSCPPSAMIESAARFAWPGRYQWLTSPAEMLVDGAHNPHAMAALLAAMDEDPRALGRPMHVVFTALCDKAGGEMVAALSRRSRSFHLCPVGSRRSRTPADLASLAPQAEVHAGAAPAITAAARAAAADGGFVLVTGSLFLAGDAIAFANGAPRDPPVDG